MRCISACVLLFVNEVTFSRFSTSHTRLLKPFSPQSTTGRLQRCVAPSTPLILCDVLDQSPSYCPSLHSQLIANLRYVVAVKTYLSKLSGLQTRIER